MSTDKIKVLYLDDEEQNLHAFKASFRREFEIFTTTSAQEAVQHLNEHVCHVVISDQKMPEVSGVEFFELIVEDFPDPARILLTGFSDLEAVIDAINKGRIFRYLTKPWDENDVRMSIKNGYDLWQSRVVLRERNKELEKSNEELEQFVYSASHDLRAPLASIKGIIKVAESEPDADLKQYMEMIRTSVFQLDEFVCDVIDYYQNRKQGILATEVDLNSMVQQVITSLGGDAGLNGLRIDIPQSLPTTPLDFIRVRMIITNLISNAIKYQKREEVHSRLEITAELTDKEVRLHFADNGQGMSAKILTHATDIFFRSNRQAGGSGLGLHIVKNAIDMLEGQISIESEPDLGTTVHVTLPTFEPNGNG